MKTIKTNDVFTENNWNKVVKKCGGWNCKGKTPGSAWCENINLKKYPFYNKKRNMYISQERKVLSKIFLIRLVLPISIV
jgi:hypothetical protein